MFALIAASLLAATVARDTHEAPPPNAPRASSGKVVGGATPDGDDEDQTRSSGSSNTPKTDAGDGDDDEKGQQSGAIVVTARRLDAARTSIDQGLGATVYELHNETIENRPGGETGSIGSILTQAPGVTLSSSGLNIRGSKAVQVRINDVIIPQAITDPEDRLSSRLAESTRLITGSLPAQFGFAPGGVIAVTTKNGLYQYGGQGEMFVGSNDKFEPAFEWGGSSGTASLFASGSIESGRTIVADAVGASAHDVRHEIGGLAFLDDVVDQENRVSLIVGGSHERREIGATDLGPGMEQTGSAYAVATYQHSTGDFTVQASLFSGHGMSSANFGRRQIDVSSSAGTQIDSSFRVGAGNTLRAGLLLSRLTDRQHDSMPIIPLAHRTSLGVYAQDEWKPDAHFTINAGVRVDWLRAASSSPAVEPRASLVWVGASGFTAHLGYARFASAPRLGEVPAAARLPNERDDYVDVGVQKKMGSVTLGVDGYDRSAHDLIIEHKSAGSSVPAAFAFAHGRFRGVEFSATYAHGPITAWTNFTVSKSQARSIVGRTELFDPDTLDAANGRWNNLASDRPVSVSGGITWRFGKLDLAGDVLAASGVVQTLSTTSPNGSRAPAFITLGIAAVYHLTLFDEPLDIRADVTNLANVHYLTNDARNLEGDWSQTAEGRTIMVGFEQGF